MKIRVERDVLAEAVAWAARSLPARPPVPVLAGLLLEAEDGAAEPLQLRLRGLRAGRGRRPRSSEEGTVLVSGRLLADICRALPNRPVEISTDGVRVDRGLRLLPVHPATLPVEDYPALPADAVGDRHGRPATSSPPPSPRSPSPPAATTRCPVLTGVRIEIEGDTVTLAATDRYRLAVREFLWKPEQPGRRPRSPWCPPRRSPTPPSR